MKPLFLFTCLLPLVLFSQEKKLESERRLTKSEFPSDLIALLQPYLATAKKIRYYEETSDSGKSFEAKLIYDHRKFSIEFSESLVLEDIEMTIAVKEIPSTTLINIRKSLQQFKKSRIEKIQKQFSSTSQNAAVILKEALASKKGELVRYELIVHGKKTERWKIYEMLFEQDGELVSIKEAVKRSSDFILY